MKLVDGGEFFQAKEKKSLVNIKNLKPNNIMFLKPKIMQKRLSTSMKHIKKMKVVQKALGK